MAVPCTVLIAAGDLLPALKAGAIDDGGELLVFPDTEALRALDVISRRRPRVVALERTFAATPRGIALINRIKADPTLSASVIRLVSTEADSLRSSTAADDDRSPVPEPIRSNPPDSAAVVAPPLDQQGTRGAPRYTIAGHVQVVVDGKAATLVDLSTDGAHVLSATILKPNQKVRMTIADDQMTMRFNAVVAWAFFEMPPKIGPRYRAGIEFLDASAADIDAYRRRRS